MRQDPAENITAIRAFEERFFEQFPVGVHRLDNGLTVLTQENREIPVVSLYTFFNVGSRNERTGITGISHLFEHMMFNGSRKFAPNEFDRILESGGGYSNAYTSKDITVYYDDFAAGLLETVLDLESDRMGWLNLSDESLAAERGVVMEERRLRTDDSLMGRLDEELYAAAYRCHPYRWPVIGWMQDIENISLEDCNSYFKTYYAPNNALMVVSGDFDTQRLLDSVERKYGVIPAREKPSVPHTAEPVQRGERRVLYRRNAELDHFAAGYHVPATGHEDVYALDVLQTILADGESSLLYRKLVRERELMQSIYADFTWHVDPSLFVFYVRMKPGKSAEEGERALLEELKNVERDGIPSVELERAKRILESDFIHGMQTNNGRAHHCGLIEIMLGGHRKMFEPVRAYAAVTEEEVRDVLSLYFKEDNRTVVRLIPE